MSLRVRRPLSSAAAARGRTAGAPREARARPAREFAERVSIEPGARRRNFVQGVPEGYRARVRWWRERGAAFARTGHADPYLFVARNEHLARKADPGAGPFRFPCGGERADFARWFGDARPVFAEFGSGYGEWVAARAAADPASGWVAVEKAWPRTCVVLGRAVALAGDEEAPDRRGPPRRPANLRVMHGDAREIVSRYLAGASLSGAFVNFPDPYFKARHAKHRLVQGPFVRDLARAMRPGAALALATDHRELMEFMCAELASAPRLWRRVPRGGALPPGYGTSSFHLHWSAVGRPAHYSEWRRC